MTPRLLWVWGFLLFLGCRRTEQPPPTGSSASARETEPDEAFAKSSPWFARESESSGFDFHHSSGKTGRFFLPEMETGGVGLIDFDQDGWMDVVCIDGGSVDPGHPTPPRHRLYRNLGHWKFVDVTESAGIQCPDGYGMGCAVGDFDGDGWPDLYITQLGGNRLFRNNKNGTFSDVTQQAGVAVHSWSTSAAFLDYDGDGHLDLAVVNYIHWTPEREMPCFSAGGQRDYCSPVNYRAPAPMTLFHNRGDGTFEDSTDKAGLLRAYGNGFGITTGDFDHDGRVDMYIANDATPNQLWINRGDGTFVDEALLRGCALNSVGVPRAGMGAVAIDLFENGWLDLYVTHLVGEGNGLFVNQTGNFIDGITPDGPMAGSVAFTGFGLAFGDFDNDGIPDLYVANGRVRLGGKAWSAQDAYAEPNTLRRGLGGGRFLEIRPQGGTEPPIFGTSRGLAVGDLDNDGRLDAIVINRDGPADMLRNITLPEGTWIGFDLRDGKRREARNAVVRIEAGGRQQWQQFQPNQGYCSSQDPRLHFGLGAARLVEHVWVRWPDGITEEFGPQIPGAYRPIQKGSGQKLPAAFSW
jgi:hypothetical protein